MWGPLHADVLDEGVVEVLDDTVAVYRDLLNESRKALDLYRSVCPCQDSDPCDACRRTTNLVGRLVEDAKKRCKEAFRNGGPDTGIWEVSQALRDLPRALELIERAKRMLELRDNWPSGYDLTLSLVEREWLNEVEK